jgi:hypothetical protein
MRDGLTDHVNQAAMVGMGEWEVNERSSPAVAGRNQGETRAVLPLSDFYTGSPESLVCPHAETTLSTFAAGWRSTRTFRKAGSQEYVSVPTTRPVTLVS